MLNVTVASFWALMLYAAFSDLRSYTLPNFISILLVVGFCVMMAVIGPPLDAVLWHLGVGAAVFAVGLILFATNIFGGGDVKVIAALALWFGPNNFLAFFTMMAIFGGILAGLLLLFRSFKLPEEWLRHRTVRGLHDKSEGVPYGIAIAIAALMEFPKTSIYEGLSAL